MSEHLKQYDTWSYENKRGNFIEDCGQPFVCVCVCVTDFFHPCAKVNVLRICKQEFEYQFNWQPKLFSGLFTKSFLVPQWICNRKIRSKKFGFGLPLPQF